MDNSQNPAEFQKTNPSNQMGNSVFPNASDSQSRNTGNPQSTNPASMPMSPPNYQNFNSYPPVYLPQFQIPYPPYGGYSQIPMGFPVMNGLGISPMTGYNNTPENIQINSSNHAKPLIIAAILIAIIGSGAYYGYNLITKDATIISNAANGQGSKLQGQIKTDPINSTGARNTVLSEPKSTKSLSTESTTNTPTTQTIETTVINEESQEEIYEKIKR